MTLLDHLLAHLADAGLVRPVGTPGPLPPLWRNPPAGTPAPGEEGRDAAGAITDAGKADTGLVVAGFITSEIPPGEGEGYSRRRVVDVHLRSKAYPQIETFSDALLEELAPAPYGRRYTWQMGGLLVIESRLWTGLGPIDSSAGQGFHHRLGFILETPR